MRLLICFALLSLRCLAAEDDNDSELVLKVVERLKRESIDKKTRTFRFVPATRMFIEGAEMITVFEGLPHQHQLTDLARHTPRVAP
jgi:hypothetical protein